jgi:hypothetical protein
MISFTSKLCPATPIGGQFFQAKRLASGGHRCYPRATVNVSELSSPEFCDALLLMSANFPPCLPSHCCEDGCHQKFSIRHIALLDEYCCKTGGLVISRHNEIRDKLSDLASVGRFATNQYPYLSSLGIETRRRKQGKLGQTTPISQQSQ